MLRKRFWITDFFFRSLFVSHLYRAATLTFPDIYSNFLNNLPCGTMISMNKSSNPQLIIDGNEIERFWSKVQIGKPDECWPWLGVVGKNEYGRFMIKSCRFQAHRAAWIFANNRDIPDGLCIRHLCNNPTCCNPVHLAIGTHQDNMRDRYSQPGATKLSEDGVREMFCLRDEGWTLAALAKRYGIGKTQVRRVLSRKNWSWLK